MRLRVGLSTCPNDTFAFHGVLADRVDRRGLDLELHLLDIQELNTALRDGRLDVSKASFFAALQLAGSHGVLPVGSALGFGVGPLLLAARPDTAPSGSSTILCPGEDTTATLLFRCFHPECRALRFVHFAEIMPALRRGDADFGVVIHEGRFTYREQGLQLVSDLGERWERTTGTPVPLGGLLARLDLDRAVVAALTGMLRDSLDHAHAHRDDALETMRRHAQELSDDVIWSHVELYVNESTRNLGIQGEGALEALSRVARERGIVPGLLSAPRILSPADHAGRDVRSRDRGVVVQHAGAGECAVHPSRSPPGPGSENASREKRNREPMNPSPWPCSFLFGLLVVTASPLAASGEEPEPTPVPGFSLTDASGRDVFLYDDREGVIATVLAWTSVECPIAKLYAPRLARLHEEYRGEGIRFLGIDPNVQDSAEEIRERAAVVGIGFPVLRDPMQVVTDTLGVTRTTEVLVLDAKMCIRYRGAVDDQYGIGSQRPRPLNEYLVEALEALLAEEPVETARTDAPGCLVGRVMDSREIDLTYHRDIAPILDQNCVECHREGQIGPMSFEEFDSARGWAPMIAEVVDNGRMPPWHASPLHGQFLNRRRLTETEKAQLILWAQNGAPEGDPADHPPAPTFPDDDWQIGPPDLIVQLPEEQRIPAEGTIPYRFVLVDPGLEEDHWIQAVEIRPTDAAATHHVLVIHVPPGRQVDDVLSEMEGDDAFLEAGYFAVNVPGARPNVWPAGTGKFLPAGSRFLFQLHYTAYGEAGVDRSRMALRFARSEVKQEVRTLGIGNTNLDIPPRSRATFQAFHVFEKPALLLSMFPHMHTRGAAFRYERIGVEDEVLLDVPEYDFNWQNFYRLENPVRIRAGETIVCTGTFDNSTENRANPDPDARVFWGDQTWEEMLIGYVDFLEIESPSADDTSSY